MSDTFVVGDVHGDYLKLTALLHGAGLLSHALHWTGKRATLLFLGDYFDRGESGVAVVNLIMRLQREAEEAGGSVGALLGNHEPLILSALWMPDAATHGPTGTFYGDWLYNGGKVTDIQTLKGEHVSWIASLPALARSGHWLLMHADTTDYLNYGHSVGQVNFALRALLARRDPIEYDKLLGGWPREFGDHRPEGHNRVDLVLRTYGAERLVHGHTSISNMTKQPLESVTEALVYDGGRCVNVDGGLGEGGQGFVYRLPD